jgi:hypothetical protein
MSEFESDGAVGNNHWTNGSKDWCFCITRFVKGVMDRTMENNEALDKLDCM